MSEQELNKSGSSCSGTCDGYSVEARFNYPSPEVIAGVLLDNRWRRLWFEEGQVGVPAHGRFDRGLREAGLYTYQGAQALRWWFVCEAENSKAAGCLCLETRLVQHRVKYSMSEMPVAHLEEMKYASPRLPTPATDSEAST